MTVWLSGQGGILLAADLRGGWNDPAVVLVHGAGETRHSWTPIAAALAGRGFLVVAIDARGTGESDRPDDGDQSVGVRAHDLALVVDQLGGRAVVVGRGAGAEACARAAATYPQVVWSALVLVDAMHVADQPDLPTLVLGSAGQPYATDTVADAVSDFVSSAANVGSRMRARP